ncbi:MAG: hypothetical protein MUC29_15165, partial [Pyrinomonadaceae bacterium]|nr:hypothetical protein [Pyrinomonadaceae bacterium]
MREKGKRQKAKGKISGVSVIFFTLYFLLFTFSVFSQNDLQKIKDGGFIEKWLISNEFPAEIDAGMWENFNRFNIENLPQKDWLQPFPKPQIGAFKSANQTQQTPKAVDSNGNPLPEIGAASVTKIFPDAINLSWKELSETDATISFFEVLKGKPIGTAYLASYINSANEDHISLTYYV